MRKKNKFTNYYSKKGDGFVCTLFWNMMSTQGNIIKHVKNVHDVVALVGDGGTVQKIKWYAIENTKVVNVGEQKKSRNGIIRVSIKYFNFVFSYNIKIIF